MPRIFPSFYVPAVHPLKPSLSPTTTLPLIAQDSFTRSASVKPHFGSNREDAETINLSDDDENNSPSGPSQNNVNDNAGQEAFNLPGNVRNTDQGRERNTNLPGVVADITSGTFMTNRADISSAGSSIRSGPGGGVVYTSDATVAPTGTLRRMSSQIINTLSPSRLNYLETGNQVILEDDDISSNQVTSTSTSNASGSLGRRASSILRRNSANSNTSETANEVIPENSNATANQVASTSGSGGSNNIIQRVTSRILRRNNSNNDNDTGISSSVRIDSDTNHEPSS